MTAPAQSLVATEVPTPALVPRLLRAVPSEPPYDDELDADPYADPADPGTDPYAGVVPLALSLPRAPGMPELDLPGLAMRPGPADPVDDGQSRRVEAELRRVFGRQRTPRAELPSPGPRAAAAVRLLLEVLVGDRPVRQISGWVSPRVLAGLDGRRPGRRDGFGRRPVVRSLRVTEPGDAVAEVSAVVDVGPRVRAVALRLEGLDGRWTVTALHVG